MLEMMMEQQQQQHNSIISLNPQNLQHHQSSEQCQKFIIPTSTNIASGTCTTSNIHDKDYNNSKGDKGENDKAILVEKETITIKQVLIYYFLTCYFDYLSNYLKQCLCLHINLSYGVMFFIHVDIKTESISETTVARTAEISTCFRNAS